MEKYKSRGFSRWAGKESISDEMLKKLLAEMGRGLLGDRLGACIYKKRLGFAGRGKRGRARTILLFKQEEIALFLYGYSKNDKDDLTPKEEDQLRTFAKEFMNLTVEQRIMLKKQGKLVQLRE